jgi:mono/diheme cytochrome c family protein
VWFLARFPEVGPPPTVLIHVSAALIQRGQYLANHVAVCMGCHSTRDWDVFSGPIVPGTEGAGGERLDKGLGFPGTFFAANITPAALGQWTDGEILRAIVCGVTRNGRAMFPVMPYPDYRALSEADAEAVVAYIRTLKPVANEIPPSRLDFPTNVLVRTFPKPYVPQPPPDGRNPVAYGRYLTTIAGCPVCHTRSEHGAPIQGMDYAGGALFDVPRAGRIQSANITPDFDTGIGNWPLDFFIARFRDAASAGTRRLPTGRRFNTIMPWTMFAGMTDGDLSAIYAYLRTVRPVRNRVPRFSGPS